MLGIGSWEPDKQNYQGSTSQLVLGCVPRADGVGPWKSFAAYSQVLASGNDSFTKVLLHFDGLNTSTIITDDANGAAVAHSWTAAGTAQINTAIYNLGGASLLCGGAGAYVTIANNVDLALSGDWTIDVKASIAGANGAQLNLCGQGNSTPTAATSTFWILRNTSNKIEANVSNGTSFTTLTSTSTFTLAASTFIHIELSRTGNTLNLFINGALEATAAFSGTIPSSTNNLSVGRMGEVTTTTWNGSIDEFRLSVGTARHTVAFTVPTSNYDLVTNGTVRGEFYARKTDGSVVVFSCTSTRIFRLNNIDLSWTDVSKNGVAYSPVPTTDHWQGIQFGNFVIFVQANTAPQVFDISSATQFSDLSGSPPQARYIAVINRFVVLTGLTSLPFRIQWSGLNAVTTWTSGVNSSDFQDFPDGGVARGVAGGEYGVVFQDSTIRSMTYAVGSAYVFAFVRIAEDKGLLAPYSIIRAGSNVFFLAAQGFQVIVGPASPPVAIGKEKVDRYFFANYDQGSLQLILGASDPQQSRVYWAWKSQSGAVGQFDQIICFDYSPQMQRWGLIPQVGEFLSSLASPGLTLEGLDTISPSIDALTFSLDDVALAALPRIVCASSNHQLGFFSGANIEATFDTAEQRITGYRARIRGLYPVTDAPTVYGSVGYRENMQAAVTYSTEQLVTSQGICWADVSTPLARGRMRIPAGVVWTFASGFDPDFVKDGRL